ncbi:MAG: class I poly(R)-hydroxyalkanoic acid synthase [Rhodospirillales bacterium]|nr:class I poly(R)-hydroxyalkanoic acid synthase [Rhodospirillales bacterium]MCB9973521.1 class I poly(R)-hydroxyalkanoic acid synthase [Rhodospirillales bacterium]MCB9980683.1 class I poly(R)-hydroxyalkanoic acid synthase [Rhodospirillales bacterium]
MTSTVKNPPDRDSASDASSVASSSFHLSDPVALAHALQPVWQKAGPLLSKIYELVQEHLHDGEEPIDPLNLREAWSEYLNYALAQPEKTMARQFLWWGQFMSLWQDYAFRSLGDAAKATTNVPSEREDRRFSSEDWNHPLFDFLRQAYLLTGRHILESLNDFDDLDQEARQRLDFALRQYISALSPTNFLFTNPEVLRKTIETGGQNLIKGLENLVHDLERGHGELRISMTDYGAFKIGENLAASKGSVVFRNDLIELLQYTPTTASVAKEPLLIIPPWINKYYILDLGQEKSFVKWLVDQGHTVFMISWVNPDKTSGQITFEDYVTKGFLSALEQVEHLTGEKSTNVIGYCIGGTMVSMGLSYLQSVGEAKRVKTVTFLTTLLDFSDSGELKLFTTEPQIELIEHQMKLAGGILPAATLRSTFSMLRANDLIWNFVINNYLIGKDPFPFDLLYWNDDSTNLPAAMHSYYLRNMYLKNCLKTPGALEVLEKPVNLGGIRTPAYFLSCKEDHIAPWKATYASMRLLSGEKRFVLSGSGHIAGVVNPPTKKKYCYWTSDKKVPNAEVWLRGTKETQGSWWPDWQKWIESYSEGQTKARAIEKSLCAAPGTYILSHEQPD